jgi:hypothetical protein
LPLYAIIFAITPLMITPLSLSPRYFFFFFADIFLRARLERERSDAAYAAGCQLPATPALLAAR